MPTPEQRNNDRIASLDEQIIAQIIIQTFLCKLISSGQSTTIANHERLFVGSKNTTRELVELRHAAISERSNRTQSN